MNGTGFARLRGFTRSRAGRLGGMVAAVVLAGLLTWRPALRATGAWLTRTEPAERADIAVMTSDAQMTGELELADLYAAGLVPRVGVLVPDPSPAVVELRRRRVSIPGPPQRLVELGIPREVVIEIPAGEGGTTDGTAALAAWCRRASIQRLIVVTSAEHARRISRALTRAFDAAAPRVMFHSPRTDPFHAADWWEHRETLRSGAIELEKLLLDYLRHPLGR